jgi:ABC-type arginine transport system permease subunit
MSFIELATFSTIFRSLPELIVIGCLLREVSAAA